MENAPVTLLVVPLIAVVAPLLARLVSRALVVPLVVFEVALGMLVGPSGLGWVADGPLLDALSQLGLAMLFFMAGNEIEPASLLGRRGKRALAGWAVSAVLALGAGFLIAPDPGAALLIGIALTGTALGTIMPMLRDSGILRTPLGSALSSAGAIGEFAPLVAISIFFSGRQPVAGLLTLLVFAGVAGLAFRLASRGSRDWLHRVVSATLRTSGQFAVRLVIAILAVLVVLALLLGVDFLLGAFTAGLLARVVLRGGDPEHLEVVEAKLESIAFGFFVPIFFVATGVSFPLASLLRDQRALLLIPVFLVAMLLVRGLPALWTVDPGSSAADRRSSAFFTATTLPLVIAVTGIGTKTGVLDAGTAAAMVGAAMLTVFLFPVIALIGRGRPGTGPGADPEQDPGADPELLAPAHE